MKAEERAKELLKAAGIPVYDPGQQVGQCKEPYVVPQCFGSYPSISGWRASYSLMLINCYVPLDGHQTHALGELVEKVREVMRSMQKQAKPTGNMSVDIIENAYKALTRTIEYQILRPIKE